MSLIAGFIQSGHLPDIEYRTVASDNIISPRTMHVHALQPDRLPAKAPA